MPKKPRARPSPRISDIISGSSPQTDGNEARRKAKATLAKRLRDQKAKIQARKKAIQHGREV